MDNLAMQIYKAANITGMALSLAQCKELALNIPRHKQIKALTARVEALEDKSESHFHHIKSGGTITHKAYILNKDEDMKLNNQQMLPNTEVATPRHTREPLTGDTISIPTSTGKILKRFTGRKWRDEDGIQY